MALSNKVLNYQDSIYKLVIKLYTSLDDIYSGRGIPFEFKDEIVYLPIVPLNDYFATPLKFSDNRGEYAIPSQTTSKAQTFYSNKVTEISLSGLVTQEETHDIFTFYAPYAGKYYFTSDFRGGQNGWGYSGDKWQYADFFLDLDGENFAEVRYRRSQGMGWKTLYDGYLEVPNGGLHTITLRILGSSSKKDSHLTACYEWDNTITMVEDDIDDKVT